MTLLVRSLLVLAVPSLAIAAEPQPAKASSPAHKQVLVPGNGTLPFSGAVRGGDLVFVSGQIGIPPSAAKPEVVAGGIGPETQATLENVAAILARAGLAMKDVVKCTVFLTDMTDFPAMNEVYTKFFPRDPPARTSAGVLALARKARVEIECIAAAR